MDRVLVNSLLISELTLSPAPWKPSKQQPAYIDVCVHTDTSLAGATDDLVHSTSYSAIANGLRKHLVPSAHPNPLSAVELAEAAAAYILFALDPPLNSSQDRVQVSVTLPDALLHGGRARAQIVRSLQDFDESSHSASGTRAPVCNTPNRRNDSLSVEALEISTVIGLNDCERLEEQPLIVDVETWPNFEGEQDVRTMAWCARSLQDVVWKHVRSSHPLLLETLCPTLSQEIITKLSAPKVRVRLDKPKAVMWTSTTAVETIRHRHFFHNQCIPEAGGGSGRPLSTSTASTQNTAYLAVGSNLGDRSAHIRRAMQLLSAAGPSILSPPSTPSTSASIHASQPLTRILDTSFLYESEPMYVLEQDRFLNAVIKVATPLSPQDLLRLCKGIEHRIGRRKTVDKGPREIDLDILMYQSASTSGWETLRDDEVDLTIPHPLIQEREFVLRPLADIASTVVHPVHRRTVNELLADLPSPSCLQRAIPSFPSSSRTLIMAILNVTPDSFSDGGAYTTVPSALQAVREHVAAGADIVDIGGVSTRPGSSHVTEAEELSRVLPVIRAVREAGLAVPLSVDTYRASVARAAIEAGATIVNDVSGGMHDPNMLSTVADLDCPFVLMHMRGKPEEVNKVVHQTYEENDVVRGVRTELARTVRRALESGIKRWNIILDPGIGFSKNAEGNHQLLRNLPAVTGRGGVSRTEDSEDAALLKGFPVLLGVSRKKFLGTLIDQPDATKREIASSAVHALAVSQEVDILRVHDTKAAREVVKVVEGVYGRGR